MEHYWNNVPGWFDCGLLYLEQINRASNGAVFVELGSWKGRSTSFIAVEIANSRKIIEFWAIDTWKGSKGEHEHGPDVRSGRLYEVFCKNIAPVRQFVRPIVSDSALAAGRFADESVDFVYVDAAHSYEGVSRDLEAWWPKVKWDGSIAGDDWCWSPAQSDNFPVRRAVEDFFKDKSVEIVNSPGFDISDWEQWLVRKTPIRSFATK